MTASIVAAIASLLAILAYFFNAERIKKARMETIYNEIQSLEGDFRKALANGLPSTASVIADKLYMLKEKYRILAGK